MTTETPSAAIEVTLSLDERVLVVGLGREHDCASWALVNGGLVRASAVVWRYVDDAELAPGADAAGLEPGTDAETLLRDTLASAELPGAVGLMTSRALGSYVDRRRSDAGLTVRCIATVGLSNALRAGDAAPPETPTAHAGTINLLCQLSRPMRAEALLETLAIASEARAAAMSAAGVTSTLSDAPATGTGTDCVVVAAPPVGATAGAAAIRFAGKHTHVGHLVGATVIETIAAGIARWRRECP